MWYVAWYNLCERSWVVAGVWYSYSEALTVRKLYVCGGYRAQVGWKPAD